MIHPDRAIVLIPKYKTHQLLQSQLSVSRSANLPKYSSSTSSNPPTSAQSISIIATTYNYPSAPLPSQHFPHLVKTSKSQTYLPIPQNRHHNLTPTPLITRNMTRKLMHIIYPHCTFLGRRSAAYAPVEGYGLACYAALEGTEN